MLTTTTKTALSTIAALCLAASVQAADLGQPEGETILTISGEITTTNAGATATFDQAMLEAMETVTYETETIWTEGPQTFTGVLLSDLMELVGATGESLAATAINDYAVKIPATDWVDGGPIIAYLQNGNPMSVRDKGPLWVIYPYDDNPDYQSEVTYSRSIWQLDRITVEK
ncbi:oxidoreductase [Pseudooceanicola nitratireducens]|jgi:hypothetical protein|uniref:oxidoreductase n=1 Tax=Pseudooceanicola nitratireducens TaxID=517719 RepID=UPI001FD4AB36|nr:oxidoreductase [Pseudooceanicola nitratireducens]